MHSPCTSRTHSMHRILRRSLASASLVSLPLKHRTTPPSALDHHPGHPQDVLLALRSHCRDPLCTAFCACRRTTCGLRLVASVPGQLAGFLLGATLCCGLGLCPGARLPFLLGERFARSLLRLSLPFSLQLRACASLLLFFRVSGLRRLRRCRNECRIETAQRLQGHRFGAVPPHLLALGGLVPVEPLCHVRAPRTPSSPRRRGG